ncbi:O-antigen ligase family protein [Candidatus Peregrinibacteria bacterium]|nr:O-antigen ligase family protein [Candidatus Peregrinibacteria bacterium]
MKLISLLQTSALSLLVIGSALLVNPWSANDIFEFPKLIMFIGFTGFLAITFIVEFAIGSAPKWREMPKEFIFLIIMLAGEILAFIFSTNRHISLAGAPFRFQGLLTSLHSIVFLCTVFFFFSRNPKEKTDAVFLSLIGALIASAVIALLPYAVSFESDNFLLWFHPAFFFDRVYGTFGNPNYFAAFLITGLPFLVAWKNFQRGRLKKFIVALLIIFILIVLFLTGARSAWIASVIGFLLWGALKAVKKHGFAMLAITLAIILLGIGGIIFQQARPSLGLERLSIQSKNLTSMQTRLYLWKSGLKLFLTRPLTGVGQDAIRYNIEPYLPDHLKANEAFFIDRTHSELIDILATRGIFAFIGYVGLFLALLTKGARFLFSSGASDLRFAAVFFAFLSLLLFHSVNFSTVSSNILLYFLGGYLIWGKTTFSPTDARSDK